MRFLVSAPGVFDRLLADFAETGIDCGIVNVRRLASEHAARTEFSAIGRILRIVGQLRLFLGIEMVEVAKELIKAVYRRQRWVAIPDVVLAELPCGVAEVLEQTADRGIELTHTHRRTRESDFAEPAPHNVLTGEECRAASRARLLTVVVLKLETFFRDAIDVGGFVAHQAIGIRADVRDADVVAPDDEDVGLTAGRWRCRGRRWCRGWRLRGDIGGGQCDERRAADQNISAVDLDIGWRI